MISDPNSIIFTKSMSQLWHNASQLWHCVTIVTRLEILVLILVKLCRAEELFSNILGAGGGRFVKKTSRKYNFPLIKNNLRHYFYFLPVRVYNILKFWFVFSVNWVLSAVFLQPFFQNSLLFAKQTLFGLV